MALPLENTVCARRPTPKAPLVDERSVAGDERSPQVATGRPSLWHNSVLAGVWPGPPSVVQSYRGFGMTETWWILVIALIGAVGGVGAAARYSLRGGRNLGTASQRTAYHALHIANLAAPALRGGLTAESVNRAVPYLRSLLGTTGLVVADTEAVLASDGVDAQHIELVRPHLLAVVAAERPQAVKLTCAQVGTCPLAAAVLVPIRIDGIVVGAIAGLDRSAPPALLRLSAEVAQFLSTQLELAELDSSKERAALAELRFLRAQISPHFVYNALTAIESYVRSDAERARRLLIGFADFTRYSFGTYDTWTTIAEELRLVDIYLDLERARFGERFQVDLRVAPETLAVQVPSLILQPVVENAFRHGLEPNGSGKLRIAVEDNDNEAHISIDDDGVGVDPAHLRRVLSGTSGDDSVGLRNVDERLRAAFGDNHGLVVETAVAAGTRVSMRIPKFSAGARVA